MTSKRPNWLRSLWMVCAGVVAVTMSTAGPVVAWEAPVEPSTPVTVVLDGHADVLYPEIDAPHGGGAATLKLRARVDGVGVVDHRDLVVVQPDLIRAELPETYTSIDDYSFLGPAGSSVWTSSEVQSAEAPWIGMSTQSESLDVLPRRQAMSFRLDAVSAPGGHPPPGEVVLWTTFGTANAASGIFFSTRQGLPSAMSFPRGGHGHFNWSFTEPGVYCLAFSVQTLMPDGAVGEATTNLTQVVGSAVDPAQVTPCARTEDYPPRSTSPVKSGNASAPVVVDSGTVDLALAMPSSDADGTRRLTALADVQHPFGAAPPTRYDLDDVILHRRAGYQPPYTALVGGGLGDLREQTLDLRVDITDLTHASIRHLLWEITQVEGPGGVRATYSWGDQVTVFDTIDADDTSHALMPGSGLQGGIWEVSRPGKYCISMRWAATMADGQILTDESVLTLVVDGPLDPGDFEPHPDGGQPWFVSRGPGFSHAVDETLAKTCADGGRGTTAAEVAWPPIDPGATGTQTITATLDENQGALVANVDPDDRQVLLPTAQLGTAGDRWWSEGWTGPLTITDTRSTNPGWSVNIQIGSFMGASGGFPAQHLGWTPRVTETSPGVVAVPGAVVPPKLGAAGPASSSSALLASARAGYGRGTATVDAALRLEVPTSTPPGSYQATLTITAI